MRSLRIVAALTATLSYTLFGAIGVGEFVLCLGEDHAAIEAAQDGRCRDLPSFAPGSGARAEVASPRSGHAGHCHRCLDLPLSISNHEQEPPEAQSLPLVGLTAIVTPDRSIAGVRGRGPSECRALELATGPPGPLAQIRTVKMTC